MSLYINATGGHQIIWHVGEGDPTNKIDADIVVSVQADGDELLYISANIEGIRFARHKRVNRWFGDDARFIVENLQ